MRKNITSSIILIFILAFSLSGCSTASRKEETIASTPNSNRSETYEAALKDHFLTIGLYETELLYFSVDDIDRSKLHCYLYDLITHDKKEIAVLSDFVVKGRVNAFAENTVYFYLTHLYEDELVNVLYLFDFNTKEISCISENYYTQRLIMVTHYNHKVVALQGNIGSNQILEPFVEMIDSNGIVESVSLYPEMILSEYADGDRYNHKVLAIASDPDYLYALELIMDNGGSNIYFTKYDADLVCLSSVRITDIFHDYDITDGFTDFYAFNDIFYFRDYSSNAILCSTEGGEVKPLLYKNGLEYAVNSYEDSIYRYFIEYKTNTVYQLNTLTGTLSLKEYNTDNANTTIWFACASENHLLFYKEDHDDSALECLFYLVPME